MVRLLYKTISRDPVYSIFMHVGFDRRRFAMTTLVPLGSILRISFAGIRFQTRELGVGEEC
jgi:hypothetical protein